MLAKPGVTRFHVRTKRILRALSTMKKNVANFFPFYHQYNAYLFNRRYERGLAPWCEISIGLFTWLSKLREEAVALAPEGRILEIGCGDGKMTSELSKNSREVVGLDISRRAIKLAKKHERRRALLYSLYFNEESSKETFEFPG
jgi:2-polyprenyl-3-methyl-5-hydroxy-6-metoxy-1,4-benzoquinol methylase